MSEIRKALEESVATLEEGKLKDLLTAGLVGGSLLMANPNDVNAKTNFNAIRGDHQITSKYEHGGKNNSAVSKDNYGGYSYGKNQISTQRVKNKPSTFDFFMRFLRDHDPGLAVLLDLAGGWEGAYKGTHDFVDTWKNLSHKDDFNQLYDSFIKNTQILPTYERMDKSKDPDLDKITTWASRNDAVQAAIESCIIQHGPAGARDIFKKVMQIYKPKTDGAFIHELYKYRSARYKNIAGAKERYANEVKDVKNYYRQLTGKSAIPKDDLKNQIKIVRPPSIKNLLAKYPIKKKNRTK